MAIYTKTGDRGETGLYGGCRINKNTPLMEAIGTIDELNSGIGLVLSNFPSKPDYLVDTSLFLRKIQSDLFIIGALFVGNTEGREKRIAKLHSNIKEMEKHIDYMWERLPSLKNFILPGGTSLSSLLFLARAICRRTERRVVALGEFPYAVVYFNRLSDYFFVLARYVNFLEKEKEIVWTG